MVMKSLQSKFILYTSLVSAVMAIAVYVSYTDTSVTMNAASENIKTTQNVRKNTIEMNNHIKALSHGVQIVMVDPGYLDQVDLIMQASFNELKQQIDKVRYLTSDADLNLTADLNEIASLLDKFYAASKDLFAIRSDVHQQYPAMKVISNDMRPARNKIYAALNIIQSEKNDINEKQKEVFDSLITDTKYKATYMLSEYRLYLAYRLGSFSEEQVDDQASIVNDLIQDLANSVHELNEFSPQLGFQSQDIIGQLLPAVNDWENGFKRVRSINSSVGWRQDTVLMLDQILPLLDRLSAALFHIDGLVQKRNTELNNEIQEINKRQNILRILVVVTFMIFGIFVTLLARNLVFLPLRKLSSAMKSDEINFDSSELACLSNSTETKSLFDAFKDMHGQVEKRQEELKKMALHDALTGLPNRKLLMQRLEHDLNIVERNMSSLNFLMLDLNGFKQVNDTLGHQVGDDLLIQVSDRLKSILRKADTIARLGGDEFSIICPSCDQAGAISIANKINETLAKPFIIDEHVVKVGTSIGIAQYPNDTKDIKELIEKADNSMYISKRNKLDFHLHGQKDIKVVAASA
jgi:diguanylate cyclase (GGDEF)-like protein